MKEKDASLWDYRKDCFDGFTLSARFHTAAGSHTAKKCHGINVQVMKTFSPSQNIVVIAGKANGK